MTYVTEHGAKVAAGKLGVTVAEYRQHEARGERWCFRCQSWQPACGTAYCRPCWRAYDRARKGDPRTARVRHAGPDIEG